MQTEFDKFVKMCHQMDSGIRWYLNLEIEDEPKGVIFPYKSGDVVVSPTDENWGTDMYGLVRVFFGDKDKGLQSAAKAFHMVLDHLKVD